MESKVGVKTAKFLVVMYGSSENSIFGF